MSRKYTLNIKDILLDCRDTICEALDCNKYKTYMALLTERCNGANPYDYFREDSILEEDEFDFVKSWQYKKRRYEKSLCESFDRSFWQRKVNIEADGEEDRFIIDDKENIYEI